LPMNAIRRHRAILWLCSIVFVTTWAPRDVTAYEPYRTETTGALLLWFDSDVDIYLSTLPPTEMSSEELASVLQEAIATWTTIEECSIPQINYAGLLDLDTARYNTEGENVNLVVPVHNSNLWASKGFSSTVIAMTTLTYSKSTGRIYDADIELNDWNFKFSTGDPVPADSSDLLNTLVHELGHFLGLDHSDVNAATMYAHAPDGESRKRDLHADDVAGICFMYDGFPFQGGDAGTAEPPEELNGCVATPKNNDPWSWSIGALCLALMALVCTRYKTKAAHDNRGA